MTIVIGIKHGGWPTLLSQDFGGVNHWSMGSWNNYKGGQSEMDSDEEAMLCLQSEVTKGSAATMGEKNCEDEMDNVSMNDSSRPTKVHRHRFLQPQNRHGRTTGCFVRYCCLHQNHYRHQHQHQEGKERGHGAMEVEGEEGEEGESRVGNKDWWIEYRSVPIEAPVSQSCLQHDGGQRLQGGGDRGGVRVKFRQLRVSLDWILSGFMQSA